MHKPTLALLLAVSSAAAAAPHDDAQAHIKAASAAYDAGAYDKALGELQAAYAIDPQPELLYAIGQAFAKLGKCTDAKASFEQFRGTTTDPDVGKVVDQAIAACQPRDEPATTTVTPTPTPITTATEPPPTDGSGSAAATEPALVHDNKDIPPALVVAPGGAWYTDGLGDGLVGAGVAATVAGVLIYTAARGKLNDAEAATTLPNYDNLVDDAHSERALSVLLLAGGGALVIGGVVHYVLHGGDASHTEHAAISVAPAASGGVVTWGGRF